MITTQLIKREENWKRKEKSNIQKKKERKTEEC